MAAGQVTAGRLGAATRCAGAQAFSRHGVLGLAMLRNCLPAFGGLQPDVRPQHSRSGMGRRTGSTTEWLRIEHEPQGGIVPIEGQDGVVPSALESFRRPGTVDG